MDNTVRYVLRGVPDRLKRRTVPHWAVPSRARPEFAGLQAYGFESPEDVVASRRERNKRKDMLRKEVQRLRKTVDKNAADQLREDTVERVASKGSKGSAGSRGRAPQ